MNPKSLLYLSETHIYDLNECKIKTNEFEAIWFLQREVDHVFYKANCFLNKYKGFSAADIENAPKIVVYQCFLSQDADGYLNNQIIFFFFSLSIGYRNFNWILFPWKSN